MNPRNKKLKILLPVIAILGIFLVAGIVYAQVNVGLEFAEGTGLGTTDIRVTIARIIRIILGALGILTVVAFLAGGVIYMTAGGDSKKVETAKKIMTNAIIGLVITLSAFAIAQYILNRLLEATGARMGTVVEGGNVFGTGFGEGVFALRGITPSGAIPIRNVTVRATFNGEVDSATVAGNILVTKTSDGAAVDGALVTARNTIEFSPAANCPEPNADRKCFDSDTEYRVRVNAGIKNTRGQTLTCGGFAPTCEATFVTGSLVDVSAPTVAMTYPDNNESISVDSFVALEALARDDAGISQIEFYVDNGFVGADAFSGATPREFIGTTSWDTTGVSNGRHTLKARAYDIDANDSVSLEISVVVRPAHCFNGVRDADEGGMDCGGTDCAVCENGPCAQNGDCASGVCRGGICVAMPRIDAIEPNNGAAGNYITITGEFFGNTAGEVKFLGTSDPADDKTAVLASCASAWQSDQVIVVVPSGAVDGPIQLAAANGEFDTTNNERGSFIENFDVNETARPGICEIDPETGLSGDAIKISGVSFGESQGGSSALLGERDIAPTLWGNTEINGTVPNIAAGRYGVYVRIGGEASNIVYFTAVSREAGTIPVISNITPASGPREEYITISGDNFGSDIGTVLFRNSTSGDESAGLTNFPPACGSNFWGNKSITVKVPIKYLDTITDIINGMHQIRVRRADGVESDGVNFDIVDGTAGPGICKIKPDNGPENIAVSVIGERFGATLGNLKFFENKNASVGSWGDKLISGFVPVGASTGPVAAIAGEKTSNPVNFRVSDCNIAGCGLGETCCESGVCAPEGTECAGGAKDGGFMWSFSTGIIPLVPMVVEECSENVSPSPSPWDKRRGGNSACANAAINVRFTAEMDETSLSVGNIGVYRCVGAGENPCAEITPVNGRIETHPYGFRFLPGGGLAGGAKYYVNLSSNIRSLPGVNMAENSQCGAGFSYCFTFGTRPGSDPCKVGSVIVDPKNYTIKSQNGTAGYLASAIDKGDICIALNSDAYNWNWSASESDGSPTLKASITERDDFGGGADGQDSNGFVDARQEATGRIETEAGRPVHINAGIVAERVSNYGELIIDFTDPSVILVWPDCDVACVNSEIGIQFNTLMNPESLSSLGNFIVYECANESCRSFLNEVMGTINYSDEEKIAVFDHVNLLPNTYYRVIIRGGVGGVKSDSGALLTKTNYGAGNRDYSWVFKTRNDSAVCAIDSVNVKPQSAVLKYVGAIQNYVSEALGAPDECSEQGQKLRATDYDWAWVSTQTSVADLWRDGTQDVLPRAGSVGCSSQCLHTGTQGGISICGNGIRDRGEDCDDGNTINSDGCSTMCLNEGSAGTCGNGIRDRGEDCDDGNTINSDGCSTMCLNEGSEFGGAICGNGDVGDGEDCDDKNKINGDGCSLDCLNEGSIGGMISVCGNSRTEAGEDCDDGNLRAGDGCGPVCLHEGTNQCVSLLSSLCCGNGGVPERGEDCDDGNNIDGDGCDKNCFKEGSNIKYNSVCGNASSAGDLEIGEECEFSGAKDGNIDPEQSAIARRGGETEIRATANEKTSEGLLQVACVCAVDSECAGGGFPAGLGCGLDKCCEERPKIFETFPADSSENVCRNPAIAVVFNQLMDEQSLKDNIRVDEQLARDTDTCPTGSVKDGAWCLGAISGRVETNNSDINTTAKFMINSALLPERKYRVRVLGDPDLTDSERAGVKNKNGVTMDPSSLNMVWSFVTGTEICLLDEVEVSPNPLYFLVAENKIVNSAAISRSNGTWQEIAPIRGVYDWEWSWGVRHGDILNITNTNFSSQTASVPEDVRKGETEIYATAEIITDTLNKPTTARDRDADGNLVAGKKTIGTSSVIVMICENPWPEKGRDGSWSPYTDIITNFKIYYCRDAGVAHEKSDDLPSINNPISVAMPPISDIIREFIIKVNCGDGTETCGQNDAMGIRVMKNFKHYSPLNWYKKSGFTGAPVDTAVDGYRAIEDGRTVYVNAANVPFSSTSGLSQKLYTNIYIISFTQNAGAETIEIHNQILENISFAVSINNWESKEQLRRDAKRLGDIRDIEELLAVYGRSHKKCSASQNISCNADTDCPGRETCAASFPKIDSGSFLQGFTNSKWPSWQIVLGSNLGASLPFDPHNYFNTGAGCAEPYNKDTCYNAESRTFVCEKDSDIYFYVSCGGGSYKLSFGLEYPGIWVGEGDPSKKLFSDLSYDLIPSAYLCGAKTVWNNQNICDALVSPVEESENGGECGNGARDDEEICDEGNLNGDYNHCNASCNGWSAWCGDGMTQSPPYGTEICDAVDLGGHSMNGQYGGTCSWDCRSHETPRCGDEEINGSEECEIGQTESTKDAVLSYPACSRDSSGYETQRTRICGETCRWGGWPNICSRIGSCGNGLKEGNEECDDGLSGNNDACADSCKNAFCGDGFTRENYEQCDLGALNGVQCSPSPGLTCTYCSNYCTLLTLSVAGRGEAPASSSPEPEEEETPPPPTSVCGNGIVETGEICDKNIQKQGCFTVRGAGMQTRTCASTCVAWGTWSACE